MGQFTPSVDAHVLDIQTVPGSARLKVRFTTCQEFFFDPKGDRYLDAKGESNFDPGVLGLDLERLTTRLQEVDRQRRFEIQKLNAEQFELRTRNKF